MENPSDDFRQLCLRGDPGRVHEALLRETASDVQALVKGIGGPRAMVRFLVQRRHILHELEDQSLAEWMREHLREAEPIHLLEIGPLLTLARDRGHDGVVRRITAHLKFAQPPDPTRWSRRVTTPSEQAFFEACETADADVVASMLADDEGLVQAIDKWGQDALTRVAAHAGTEGMAMVSSLCTAGTRRWSQPAIAAAWRGATDVLKALIAHDMPMTGPIDHDALWTAAAATRDNALPVATFEAMAPLLLGAGCDLDAVDRWGTTAWGIASTEAKAILVALGAKEVVERPGRYDAATGLTQVMTQRLDGAQVDVEDDVLDVNEAACLGREHVVLARLDAHHATQKRLRADGSPERPLHFAAFMGAYDVARTLVFDHGYSPAELNRPLPASGGHIGPAVTWDKSALEVAVAEGHEKVVDMFLNTVDFFQGRRARRK